MKSLIAPTIRRRLLPNPFARPSTETLLVCDPSDYCPGCNTRLGCACPSAEHEDALLEASFALGLDHGAADGPENRPTRRWCADANLDADEYLAGYDAGCRTSVVCEPALAISAPRATARRATAPRNTAPRTRRVQTLLTDSEARARRVAAEAERWLAFAGERTRMRPETLIAKTLQSACFSAQAGATGFAVPSKLVGVRDHQRRLWALVRDGYDRYERLELGTATTEGIRVTRGDDVLGEVQPKHVPWVRPLVPFGLTVHLGRVTGHETEGHTLGVNIVFGGVGRAMAALAAALGESAWGDGAAGDGAPGNLRLAVPEPTQNTSTDVVLWRDDRGTARASMGTAEGAPLRHIVRHSPTGIEWGYSGSGPSDLALSVLTVVAGADAAERHYRALVAEVISRAPKAGGVLRAERVRTWLCRQTTGDQEEGLSEAPKPGTAQSTPTSDRAAA